MPSNKKSAPVAGGTTIRAEGSERRGGLNAALRQSIARETNGVNGAGEAFARCRESVSAEEAARMYGIHIDHSGKARCPFHDDHRPSMSFHAGRFRCWSCGASGNCIDLTMKLLGVDAMGAVRRLDADCHLGLPLDRPLSREERDQADRRRQLNDTRQRFEEWREKMLRNLNTAYRIGHQALLSGHDLSDHEALAVRWMDALEAWADALDSKELSEQMKVFRDRQRVEEKCRMILNATPMK